MSFALGSLPVSGPEYKISSQRTQFSHLLLGRTIKNKHLQLTHCRAVKIPISAEELEGKNLFQQIE